MSRTGSSILTRSALALFALAPACGSHGGAPLNKSDAEDSAIPPVVAPPETGPKLGAIANATAILEKPVAGARWLGALHGGALVARGQTPVRKSRDCEAGYYAVFPRGVVCLSQGATLDLGHPTLAAMAIQPTLDQPLPYTYGRTREDGALYERDPASDNAVREVQKLPRGSAMAIVGSWSARIGNGEAERFGLLTNGRFVRARELEAVRGSNFSGVEVSEKHELPVAFVVKRGVSNFKPDDDRFTKADALEYHATIPLSGRFRTLNGTKLWAAEGERWVREQDVTIVHRRTHFPDFVRDGQRWLDIGVILGTLVAYEGKNPIFATLVSTGRDRLSEGAASDGAPAVTKLGTFEIVAKHVTLLGAPPERAAERFAVFDLPWALELSSGQALFAAYWHDRFGIERGPGDVELAPIDAQRLFQWASPALPKGWHAAGADPGQKTLVVVHK
jgi:hypothetical protein